MLYTIASSIPHIRSTYNAIVMNFHLHHISPNLWHQILFKHHSQHPFHHCICFSLSNVLHPFSPLISSFITFVTSQSHIYPFQSPLLPKHLIRACTMPVLHIHTLASLLPYSSIILCQLHIYFQTFLLHYWPYQILHTNSK